ncbi:MAG: PleD family two-component system response regulator [Armatimonadota bacterium]
MHQQRGRLLLVDGNAARAQHLASRLSSFGFDIEVVDNGAVGLLKAHDVHPDVVVAAAQTPVLNGFLLLQALREDARTSKIPVILVTEGSSQKELTRGWEAGADLCVPMNLGEADVVSMLRRALQSVRPAAASPALALAS